MAFGGAPPNGSERIQYIHSVEGKRRYNVAYLCAYFGNYKVLHVIIQGNGQWKGNGRSCVAPFKTSHIW
jgi:hypothetical protein